MALSPSQKGFSAVERADGRQMALRRWRRTTARLDLTLRDIRVRELLLTEIGCRA